MYQRILSVLILFSCLLLGTLSAAPATTVAMGGNVAFRLQVDGPIGPAVQEYVEQGLQKAASEEANLVILQIDTPGGLGASMRGIIRAMLASPVPVVVYVAPSGAHAASAGTYILYAANIAAMAPGTNLGAATPVNLIGGDKKTKKAKPSASESKALNDARAYIRSLAQMRNRNAKWGEQAVTRAASLSAKEALARRVIEVIAPNIPSLLKQINGKPVVVNGQVSRLNTQGMVVVSYAPNWRAKLLSVITNPSVAYIFLMIAFYGLFFEFAHPGFIVPGVLGGIALILGLYGLQLLPINYVGLGLIILGFAFFVGEAFVPSFGVLGIGGLIAFVIGSVMLLNTDLQGFTLPWQLITGVSVATILFVLLLVQLVFRARRRPKRSGDVILLGQTGEVVLDHQHAWLKVNGELWRIANPAGLVAGDRARVLSVDGLTIRVEVLK